ncbi:toxin TcdB middle/N-terminal domain-containing protein, partial [Mesorhizobium sp. B2-8-9]|uniref:toxin TcdB middle/N-terminal domain-containing protein n=1 Tax=Mesorhizobium sp. B2-8-9 TaxID=2589899 RepID=UPI00116D7F93
MKRLLVGAAVLAAWVVGADISAVSYISRSEGIVAFAQQAQGSSINTSSPAISLGNGGAGFKSSAPNTSGTTDQPQAGGSGTTHVTGSPDAAFKVGAKPDDAKNADGSSATDDSKAADSKTTGAKTTDKTAKTGDTKAAPEEPAAQAATAATTTTTSGDPEAIGTPKVDLPKAAGNGNLGYSIAIDVPAFHGIEPQIGLNYNSSRKTKLGGLYQGWLGYAWGLDGIDVIERSTPGYGMPAYDANDIYLLDGQAMVACVAGMVSPSCSTGGTHATENESYRRIALNSTTNEWKVTDRDGTVSTFRSVGAVANLNPAAGTPAYDLAFSYRWLLTSVTDTNGNTVTYNYTCPASPTCYPASVTYNGTSIQFYYETRPDLILMGNGRDISVTDKRIKTIGITVSGAVRGAYALTYDQAPFSNASRLTQVTLYGTDATIAADGTITGRTSKVIAQMAYQNADGVYGTVAASFQSGGGTVLSRSAEDLDFDGRDEIFGEYTITTTQRSGGSSGDTTTTEKQFENIFKFGVNGASAGTTSTQLESHVVVLPDSYRTGIRLGRLLANKNTMDFVVTTTHMEEFGQNGNTRIVTVNSILTSDPQLALTKANCAATPPTGYEAVCNGLPGLIIDASGTGVDAVNASNSTYAVNGVGDFLGNGKQQPLYWGPNGTSTKGVLSNGKWQPGSTSYGIACSTGAYDGGPGSCALADINGDGATDVVLYNGTNGNSQVWLSTGVGFKSYTVSAMAGTSAVVRDFDNSGKASVITIGGTITSQWGRTGTVRVFSLRPSSASMTPVQFTLPVSLTAGTVVGDFNGDGLPDFTNYSSMFISNAGTGNPNLVKQIVTELGGTVAVEYTPSSRWTNNYLPQVVHAVTKLSLSDGRGQTAVSTYQYAGGKYDPAARKFLGFASIV